MNPNIDIFWSWENWLNSDSSPFCKTDIITSFFMHFRENCLRWTTDIDLSSIGSEKWSIRFSECTDHGSREIREWFNLEIEDSLFFQKILECKKNSTTLSSELFESDTKTKSSTLSDSDGTNLNKEIRIFISKIKYLFRLMRSEENISPIDRLPKGNTCIFWRKISENRIWHTLSV